jgi:DNA repair and recombination protein RAD52
MTFNPEQVAALKAPLDRAVVKSREQGKGQVSYIEAYHAENEANRIFGFDGWDRETYPELVGEPRLGKDKYGNDQWRVAYRAKVRITVRAGDTVVIREGCGFGTGIDRDVDQAHESALKEAESDAEKRALKTFGNPFGQALYDKKQAQVSDGKTETPPKAEEKKAPTLAERAERLIASLQAATDPAALEKAMALGSKLCAELDLADPDLLATVTLAHDVRRDELDANPFVKAA